VPLTSNCRGGHPFEGFRNAVVEDILTVAEVHLFQTTSFDPLRNPDPQIEKRHKRLMSYRRMLQRTAYEAAAEIQRSRDLDAELAGQQAKAAPAPAPADDLQKQTQIGIGPNDPTLEQVLDPNFNFDARRNPDSPRQTAIRFVLLTPLVSLPVLAAPDVHQLSGP
jgi:hypothetical protein